MKAPTPDLLRDGKLTIWWWLLLIPVAWWSLFWRIGERPLQTWDESRLAVNAAEMLRTHNWIVTSYSGEPDLWNTKPPLLIWLQALSLQMFGYSEWAFRLPTTLAALAVVALIVVFARRWLGGPLAGLLTGLALLTSKGFVTHHIARSGDYEALLLLFMTGQVVAVFAWLQTQQRRYILLAGITIGLAILTKSVAGLLFLPGLAIEVTRRRRLISLLQQSVTWISLGIAVGLPSIWYALREQAGPGYLLAVWQNEWGGRFMGVLEEHTGPWYFYLLDFVSRPFLLWTPWMIGTIWLLARRPHSHPAYQFLMLVAWVGGVFLLLISTSATKLVWYNAPLYPLLALLLGSGLAQLVRRIATIRRPSLALFYPLLIIALAFIPSGIAMHQHLAKLHEQRYDIVSLTYGRYLQDCKATPVKRYTLLSLGYNAPLEFYALAARHASPTDTIAVVYSAEDLVPGQVVLVCGNRGSATLSHHYNLQVLHQADSCTTYLVKRLR